LGIGVDAIHDNVQHIPTDPLAVGGYINGVVTRFIWTDADWAHFPVSYHIRINVTGERGRGNCLDVERGDATPADVQPWLESVASSPDPLLIYCNGSNLSACLAARRAAGVHAWMWEATLDGTVPNRAMVQCFQTKLPSGAAVTDVSLILDPRLRAAMVARIGRQ